MPPAIASLATRLFDAAGAGRAARMGVLVLLHLAALVICSRPKARWSRAPRIC
jgi:hypothetical protein